MEKGDRRTRRGKLRLNSYGKTRNKKSNKPALPTEAPKKKSSS